MLFNIWESTYLWIHVPPSAEILCLAYLLIRGCIPCLATSMFLSPEGHLTKISLLVVFCNSLSYLVTTYFNQCLVYNEFGEFTSGLFAIANLFCVPAFCSEWKNSPFDIDIALVCVSQERLTKYNYSA